jgi:hypothetical protein
MRSQTLNIHGFAHSGCRKQTTAELLNSAGAVDMAQTQAVFQRPMYRRANDHAMFMRFPILNYGVRIVKSVKI